MAKRISKNGNVYKARATTRIGRLALEERVAIGQIGGFDEIEAIAGKVKVRDTRPTETQEHLALAQWLRVQGIFFFHVPNEAKRSRATHTLLLRMGMVPGASDFIIPGDPLNGIPNVSLELKRPSAKDLLELKLTKDAMRDSDWATPYTYMGGIKVFGQPIGSGSVVSDNQILFLQEMEELGWETSICYGWERAVGYLRTLPLKKRKLKRI